MIGQIAFFSGHSAEHLHCIKPNSTQITSTVSPVGTSGVKACTITNSSSSALSQFETSLKSKAESWSKHCSRLVRVVPHLKPSSCHTSMVLTEIVRSWWYLEAQAITAPRAQKGAEKSIFSVLSFKSANGAKTSIVETRSMVLTPGLHLVPAYARLPISCPTYYTAWHRRSVISPICWAPPSRSQRLHNLRSRVSVLDGPSSGNTLCRTQRPSHEASGHIPLCILCTHLYPHSSPGRVREGWLAFPPMLLHLPSAVVAVISDCKISQTRFHGLHSCLSENKLPVWDLPPQLPLLSTFCTSYQPRVSWRTHARRHGQVHNVVVGSTR